LEVTTIKPSARTDGVWRLQPTPDGYTALDVSLRKLIQEAYGIYDDKLLTGGPPWIDTDKFDLEAKFDPSDIPNAKNLTYRQRADMLRAVLADRFQLKVHFEKKDLPVYNLVVAKGGPKLSSSNPPDDSGRQQIGTCNIVQQRTGITQRRQCQIGSLTDLLRFNAGRTVIDETGLTGRYDFELHWTPDNTPESSPLIGGPSIFTAVEEQLGLKLEPSNAPLDVLVIDSIQKPSEN
jgi:uncharacterized protein (TIGR03435 family)